MSKTSSAELNTADRPTEPNYLQQAFDGIMSGDLAHDQSSYGDLLRHSPKCLASWAVVLEGEAKGLRVGLNVRSITEVLTELVLEHGFVSSPTPRAFCIERYELDESTAWDLFWSGSTGDRIQRAMRRYQATLL